MNLPGFNPSEEDLYNAAISQPLDKKIQMAVNLIGTMCDSKNAMLAFSGGKDSIVIRELKRLSGIKTEDVYSVTTIDPPELVRYIMKHHEDVRWIRQPKTLLQRMIDGAKGPPTRLSRWCCEEYKENTGAGYDAKIIGVRAAESARRKGLWKQVNKDLRGNGIILAPIVYWTDQDVWEFIRRSNLPYCELYDEGFSRLGCVGCPLAGPACQRREFDRWPGFERVWRRAFDRFWDRWHDVPTRSGKRRYFEDFGSADGLWRWWISGKAHDVADHQQEFDFDDDCKDGDCQSRFYTI